MIGYLRICVKKDYGLKPIQQRPEINVRNTANFSNLSVAGSGSIFCDIKIHGITFRVDRY